MYDERDITDSYVCGKCGYKVKTGYKLAHPKKCPKCDGPIIKIVVVKRERS